MLTRSPTGTTFLDEILEGLLRREFVHHIDALAVQLNALRQEAGPEIWRSDLIFRLREHPLGALLRECPYTHRALQKPRGYAGDAVMLDYLYERIPPEGTSERGAAIFEETTGNRNGHSVRFRRDHLAQLVDGVAQMTSFPHILSVACGHLRELEHSKAFAAGQLGPVTALDQDPHSLETVHAHLGTRGVQAVQASVKSLVVSNEHGPFDLIYSAGLYDYLPDDFARTLTRRLFDRLNPGGTLLYANFLPENYGRGYMEAFMDWHLMVRTLEETQALSDPLEVELASRWAYVDPFENVVYVVLTKA